MTEQRPLARVILTTVDMLRACRDEIAKLDKSGCPAIAGRPETRQVAHQTGALVPALIEIAARLAVVGSE
ncbi:MAG TPA: hypothetical protein VH682_12440 [Gemmataceae bacterium]|jgi:hypothetical protein